MAIVKAKENYTDNVYWYFSEDGIVKMTIRSGKRSLLNTLLFGGAAGNVASLAMNSSKVKKWDGMSLEQLKGEEGSEFFPWSDVERVALEPSLKYLEVTLNDNQLHKMDALTDVNITQKLFQDNLGDRFAILKYK